MNLVISQCVTAVKVSKFTCHYLGNCSTLDIGVLGYIGIVQHKEHHPEVWSLPPVTPCISIFISSVYFVTLHLYYIFYFMYTHNLTKTNEISFNTHLLVIAYYVYMYSVTL